jgi:outer membrane immunogenic protein
MNIRNLLSASAIAFLALGTTAYAADVVSEEPPVPEASIPLFSWTGAYIGINGGYAWTNAEFSAGGASVDDDFNGGLLGVRAGYNWQMPNNFVGGIELDVDHVWNKNSYVIGGVGVEAGSDWQGSARLRLGYAIDRTLFFGTGGVAIANAYAKIPATGANESETFTGWTLGAGIEHAFTDNLIGSLEYRYADYGSKDIGGLVDVDLDQHTVRLGLAYKF